MRGLRGCECYLENLTATSASRYLLLPAFAGRGVLVACRGIHGHRASTTALQGSRGILMASTALPACSTLVKNHDHALSLVSHLDASPCHCRHTVKQFKLRTYLTGHIKNVSNASLYDKVEQKNRGKIHPSKLKSGHND